MSEPIANEVQEIQDGNILVEYFNNLRKFEIQDAGQKYACVLREPTPDEQMRANAYLNLVYERKRDGEEDPITHVVFKLPTKDNMMEAGRQRGIWTDQDEIDYVTLTGQIDAKTEQVRRGPINKMPMREAHQKCLEIRQHRIDLQPLNVKKLQCYQLTANAVAEESYHKYIVVATAEYEDGSRVFKDMKDFENPTNNKSYQILQYYHELNNHISEFTNLYTVENSFFRDYGFLAENGDVLSFDRKAVLYNINDRVSGLETIDENTFGYYDDDGETVILPVHMRQEADDLQKSIVSDETPFEVADQPGKTKTGTKATPV